MRDLMMIVESDWLENRRRENTERLMAEWPEVTPGMFVRLQGYSVWMEITRVSKDTVGGGRFNSVSFYRYEKYGVTRKPDHAYYGEIAAFATRDEVIASHDTFATPTVYNDHGYVVEWPAEGPFRRDAGGYEMHPTISKEQARETRDRLFYGRK